MLKKSALYPLKFVPILKQKVWGGNKLVNLFQKEGEGLVGESWEISGVAGNISVVSNGELKGKTIIEVLDDYKADFIGAQVYDHFGKDFPLLFKFIDAREDLSVQLHPNDQLAKKRHNSFGKTEMWYIMDADKDADIILGFNKEMDEATYLKYLSANRLPQILHHEKVTQGDSFFIAPGTVHAIGGGVLLAEIQQTSDITYRIYDWDRPDTDGKLRELHTEQALEAINFEPTNAKILYDSKDEKVRLASTPFFETNRYILNQNLSKDLSAIDSFVVYMCVEGAAILKGNDFSEEIKKGETILIPACINKINFETTEATLLEVYIP